MVKKKKSKEPKQKEDPKEQPEVKDEKGGFPENVDFKRFLGCGG